MSLPYHERPTQPLPGNPTDWLEALPKWDGTTRLPQPMEWRRSPWATTTTLREHNEAIARYMARLNADELGVSRWVRIRRWLRAQTFGRIA